MQYFVRQTSLASAVLPGSRPSTRKVFPPCHVPTSTDGAAFGCAQGCKSNKVPSIPAWLSSVRALGPTELPAIEEPRAIDAYLVHRAKQQIFAVLRDLRAIRAQVLCASGIRGDRIESTSTHRVDGAPERPDWGRPEAKTSLMVPSLMVVVDWADSRV